MIIPIYILVEDVNFFALPIQVCVTCIIFICISSCLCVCIFCVPSDATQAPRAGTRGRNSRQHSARATQHKDNKTNTKADNQSTAAMTVVVFSLSVPKTNKHQKVYAKKGACARSPPPSPLCSLAGPGAERGPASSVKQTR